MSSPYSRNLKTILKNRKAKEKKSCDNLARTLRLNDRALRMLETVGKALSDEGVAIATWNGKLKGCGERLTAGKKGRSDAIRLIKKADRKYTQVASALNFALNELGAISKTCRDYSAEMTQLRADVSEFVLDTVDEINEVTAEARDRARGHPAPKGATGGARIVTSLFRLYDDREPCKTKRKRGSRKKRQAGATR